MYLEAEYFSERMQCSRADKQESLFIVELLLELSFTAYLQGVVALDKLLEEQQDRFRMPFLRKAIQLVTDVGSQEKAEKIMYQFILSSNYTGRQFLLNVVIAEVMLAIHRNDDPDYIFNFLVPSLFGLDFDDTISGIYRHFRHNLKKWPEKTTDSPPPEPA